MNDTRTPAEILVQAVESAGGTSAFARICGCTQSNISQLITKGSPLPARYVLAVEAANLGFSRHHLRPDLYPLYIVERDDVVRRRRRGAAA